MPQPGPLIGEIIQLVSLSLSQVESVKKSEQLNNSFCDSGDVPSFINILEWLDVKQGIKLEYEVICSSFLLKLLDDDETNDDEESNDVKNSHVAATINKELKCIVQDVVNRLRAYQEDKQLIMF